MTDSDIRPKDSAASPAAWQEKRAAAEKRKPSVLLGKVLYLQNVTVSFDGFKALIGSRFTSTLVSYCALSDQMALVRQR